MSSNHSNISIFVPHLGCPHQCSFCNQHHISGVVDIPTAESVDVAVNIAKNSRKYDPDNTEIAFFGGSFTAIERDYMLSLLSAAKRYVDDKSVCGIRISTRPDAIDTGILSLLKAYGVTTIELGAQSMDDEVLALNERGHSSDDVRTASVLIKEYGFNLGLQMMTGLYGSGAKNDICTAEEIISLNPDCVRIYPTVTLKNTRLAELFKAGKYSPPELDNAVELCVKIKEMFENTGINVIRVGLHSIENDSYVAGPWHPAFKELCDSLAFKKRILNFLEDMGSYEVFVNPHDVSKAVGQARGNIAFFKEKGYDIKIISNNDISKNEVLVKRV